MYTILINVVNNFLDKLSEKVINLREEKIGRHDLSKNAVKKTFYKIKMFYTIVNPTPNFIKRIIRNFQSKIIK